MIEKIGQNPMLNISKAHAAPRCGARTRRGAPCQGPAMANGRCYMHGGASTGPRTAEGLERIRLARTVHGGYGAAITELRDWVRILNILGKKLAEMV